MLGGSSDLPGGCDAPSRHAPKAEAPGSLPIWSCSVWGLPCPPHYCGSGALLPHLFTLTSALPPGRYVFCGTFRRADLNPPSRTLSGTLLCGVRTFLSPRPKARKATVRSSCQLNHYMRCGRASAVGLRLGLTLRNSLAGRLFCEHAALILPKPEARKLEPGSSPRSLRTYSALSAI